MKPADLQLCVIWPKSLDGKGYGQVNVGGKLRRAHRVLYEVAKGPIPAGLELDHLCGTKACVNPDHLEPVTHQENMRRAAARGEIPCRMICPCGRPYDRITFARDGRRQPVCRACRNAANRRYQARKKGQAA